MPPALEPISPRYFLNKTLHEIADWLQANRVRTSDFDTSGEDSASLRQQFGQLSHRWHPVLTDQLLREPQLAPVHQLAVQALGVSRLIYAELENERQGQSQQVPKSSLACLLELNSHLLDRVAAQLELVDSTTQHAEDLHEAVKQLIVGQTVSPVWLMGLARRIVLEMRPAAELWQWLPLPGLKLNECLPSNLWKSEAEIYATGIQSARLTAWLGSQCPQFADRLELLVMAALLQDIGFFRLERIHQKSPSELAVRWQDAYRRHPSQGAALAAGVGDYSIELSFLIAQHHERLDGTGYPHGLTRYKLSKEVQFLAGLVRFQELLSRRAEERSVEAACFQAGFQLFLESAQGAWSTRTTMSLLEALDSELPKTFDTALATGQPFVAGPFLEKRWALHSAEAEVPAPHFLFSRSKSPSRFARQTLSGHRPHVVRHDPKG